MNIIAGIVGLFVLTAGFLFAYAWFRLHASLHVHTNEHEDLLRTYPLKHTDVHLTTRDGFSIAAWYIPVPKPKAVVILLHGFTDVNGGKALMLPHAAYLHAHGYTTLLIDFRANGDSDGTHCTLGVTEWQDAEAAFDYAAKQPENTNVRIGFFGISMGAATAIITAGKTGKGDFVIASVPYAGYHAMFAYQSAKEHLPLGSLSHFFHWPPG